jgi:hypothetical protein
VILLSLCELVFHRVLALYFFPIAHVSREIEYPSPSQL